MTVQQETRRAVETYFAAWTAGDVDAAYAMLADDLTFVGPTASYQSAGAFRPALKNFAAMTKAARIIELIVQDDRAAMLYECELGPVDTLRIASFFRVENARIRWYETQFDATELRKLLPTESRR